uniref:Uncharacterized protein n=1 Tax=Zea mays TaxID=4577 RepID=C4IYN7_MAIZE|nr:unknown [Zea mays]
MQRTRSAMLRGWVAHPRLARILQGTASWNWRNFSIAAISAEAALPPLFFPLGRLSCGASGCCSAGPESRGRFAPDVGDGDASSGQAPDARPPIGYPGMPLYPRAAPLALLPAASGLPLPPPPSSSSLPTSEICDITDPCRDEKLSCPLSRASLTPFLNPPPPMPTRSMLPYPLSMFKWLRKPAGELLWRIRLLLPAPTAAPCSVPPELTLRYSPSMAAICCSCCDWYMSCCCCEAAMDATAASSMK